MSLSEAIGLGVVQGLTEFLPVSSSGHLVIIQHFLPDFAEPGQLFDLLLHLGTVVAACVYFRRDLAGIFRGFLQPKEEDSRQRGDGRRLGLLVLVGSLPTALIGLAFKEQLTLLFERPRVAAAMLLLSAALLYGADRMPGAERGLERMNWRQALLIGTVQGLAIIPGISRSGSTIATGIFCRLDRDLAARYSFLLMIPAVLGASLLQARHLWGMCCGAGRIGALLAGFLSSLLVGYLTIDLLMKVVRSKRLSYFAYYCLALGAGALVLLAL